MSAPHVRSEFDELVVHPYTGQVLGGAGARLDTVSTDVLAEVFAGLKTREAELAAMRKLVDAELARRLTFHERTVMVAGEWEVSYKASRKSEWDGAELERVLESLVESGTVKAGELTGIVDHTPSVSGREANRLASRLSGEARAAVENCRAWVEGRRALTVTPSRPLLDEPQQD